MSSLTEFTDDEIKEQLHYLGFKNVPRDKFNQFKTDLQKLITEEISLNSSSSNSFVNFADNHKKAENRKVYSKETSITESIVSDRTIEPQENFLAKQQGKSKRVTFPDDFENLSLDESDGDQSIVSIRTTSSIVDNKVFKRKIIRKTSGSSTYRPISESKGEARGSDERVYSEDDLNNRFFDENVAQSDDEQFVKLNNFYPPVNYPTKSFIRSQSSISLRSDYSKSVKSNPVQKFQQYQKLWNKQKVPGEKNHNNLRWSVREQMLEKHVIVKKQPKSYVANAYTIPTEKKRQQLRWMVRNALANPI